jgi:hypothetical protein
MKALLSAVVLLLMPSIAHALPFNPDSVEIASVDARFVETGTNSACINCLDGDPLNDIKVLLDFGALIGGAGFLGVGQTVVDFAGTTATDFTGLDLTIRIDLHLIQRVLDGPPEELALYPLPSHSFGMLSGFLMYFPFDGVVLECCNGWVDNVRFAQAFYPSTPFPPDAGIHSLYTETYTEFNAPYNPAAIPEPASFLLLGGGLIVAEWKRRRGQQN